MSDIFSLGVIIMEVIMGHRDYPYDLKASSEEFINKVRKQNFEMENVIIEHLPFLPYINIQDFVSRLHRNFRNGEICWKKNQRIQTLRQIANK
jgi:hypothetical protein